MQILNICLEMVYEMLPNNLGHYTSDIKKWRPRLDSNQRPSD